jgi:hypothetical protein
MLRLDQNSSLAKQGISPDWLVFTEASDGSTCLIRSASVADVSWIRHKLPLLDQIDIKALCGCPDTKVGSKRPLQQESPPT